MANTGLLKTKVEDYVRGCLRLEYGVEFSSQVLRLGTGGTHEYDAVSTDRQIVASIKSASGLTSRGRIPSGKIKDSEAELYYLLLCEAATRLLILTNPSFHQILTRRLRGRLAAGIAIKLVELPTELQDEVTAVQLIASREMAAAASLIDEEAALSE